MKTSRIILAFALIALTASVGFSRNILEKKMFYLSNANKVGQAKFWVIYLGNHDCKLIRSIPGEGNVNIDASVNFQLLSSGYVEGNGYGTKGKVDCLPTMMISVNGEEKRIVMDSIDYIYDFGRKVRMKTGDEGELVLDVENNKKFAKKFIMREYKLTEYFGEQILKEGSEETPLMAISLTQEGIARAQKAQAALDAAAAK